MTPWVCCGAATTARGMIPGHPAVGSRDGPWGTCPHQERGQSAAAQRRGLATHWRRLRYWRGHKRQRQAGEGAAVSEQWGGAQPSRRLEASARNKKKYTEITPSTGPVGSRPSCRLCLTSQEKKKQAWKEVALHPPLSAGPAGGRPYGNIVSL